MHLFTKFNLAANQPTKPNSHTELITEPRLVGINKVNTEQFENILHANKYFSIIIILVYEKGI